MEENAEETEVLRKELKWLLDDQVHQVLQEIHRTLLECSRRFPSRTPPDEDSLVKPQRILMSSPNGSGQIQCVVTLLGDRICDADITFKHKQGKDHHMYKTGLNQERVWRLQQVMYKMRLNDDRVLRLLQVMYKMELNHERVWRLQQLQDASNFLFAALNAVQIIEKDHIFTSAKEVVMILDDVMSNLTQGRSCLSFPKRKSIEELLNNANMQMLYPAVPNDVAISFYIHSSKLMLALYHLHNNGKQRIDITSRYQVESSVQWLNEAVILFTVALQHCQQLKDKIVVLRQYEEVS